MPSPDVSTTSKARCGPKWKGRTRSTQTLLLRLQVPIDDTKNSFLTSWMTISGESTESPLGGELIPNQGTWWTSASCAPRSLHEALTSAREGLPCRHISQQGFSWQRPIPWEKAPQRTHMYGKPAWPSTPDLLPTVATPSTKTAKRSMYAPGRDQESLVRTTSFPEVSGADENKEWDSTADEMAKSCVASVALSSSSGEMRCSLPWEDTASPNGGASVPPVSFWVSCSTRARKVASVPGLSARRVFNRADQSSVKSGQWLSPWHTKPCWANKRCACSGIVLSTSTTFFNSKSFTKSVISSTKASTCIAWPSNWSRICEQSLPILSWTLGSSQTILETNRSLENKWLLRCPE